MITLDLAWFTCIGMDWSRLEVPAVWSGFVSSGVSCFCLRSCLRVTDRSFQLFCSHLGNIEETYLKLQLGTHHSIHTFNRNLSARNAWSMVFHSEYLQCTMSYYVHLYKYIYIYIHNLNQFKIDTQVTYYKQIWSNMYIYIYTYIYIYLCIIHA